MKYRGTREIVASAVFRYIGKHDPQLNMTNEFFFKDEDVIYPPGKWYTRFKNGQNTIVVGNQKTTGVYSYEEAYIDNTNTFQDRQPIFDFGIDFESPSCFDDSPYSTSMHIKQWGYHIFFKNSYKASNLNTPFVISLWFKLKQSSLDNIFDTDKYIPGMQFISNGHTCRLNICEYDDNTNMYCCTIGQETYSTYDGNNHRNRKMKAYYHRNTDWNHVMFTRDENGIDRFYINGIINEERYHALPDINATFNNITVGSAFNDVQNSFNYYIDDPLIATGYLPFEGKEFFKPKFRLYNLFPDRKYYYPYLNPDEIMYKEDKPNHGAPDYYTTNVSRHNKINYNLEITRRVDWVEPFDKINRMYRKHHFFEEDIVPPYDPSTDFVRDSFIKDDNIDHYAASEFKKIPWT